ncbi:M1 family metallopeptidase [Olivibacter ginsenosidimutans]|uniref:Aminopeptidase N n=1 Tax=Olivibacter ginsenosidimutans TaxID=1176537 RepID=A0ABP9AS94_9SPHI
MNKQLYWLSLLCSICIVFSCASTKHVDIPPVTIYANAPGVPVYQESYPIKIALKHTKLDLRFDWEKSWVFGEATLTVQPYFYPQDSVVLDANGFDVQEVARLTSNGKSRLHYTYNGKKLAIALDKSYTKDESCELFIRYIAKPNELQVGEDIASIDDRGLYFIQPNSEIGIPRQLWSQGETECNSNWFPTVNNTMVKMTQEVSLTVPDSMVTLSNGLMKTSRKNGDGTRTDTWLQDKPHSPYLTMIAAGVFQVTKDEWQGKEVSYYMEPAFAPYARKIFGNTPEMLSFFSQKLGVTYPWDKYAQIVVRNFVSGAMENTTATVFFDRMNLTPAAYKDETYEDIIAHELFHHWFGDLVTAESWSNLPLNESFATYGEYLWITHKYGQEAADMHALNDILTYFDKDTNATLDVIRFDYANREQLFDAVSYQKGGRILHMLRKTVGDEAFFAALQWYLKQHAYQSVEIHDLRLAFEKVTGQDLNWFFNQWFLASGNPDLHIESQYEDSTKQVVVNLTQQQDLTKYPLYRLPMAVDLYVQGKVIRKQITLTKQQETFRFPLAEAPQLVDVDADKYLLARKEEQKTLSEWIFQYQHAPLFMDRFEAIQQLLETIQEPRAQQILITALQDKAWIIRLMVLQGLEKFSKADLKEIFPTIKKLAISDSRSYVRAGAIMQLKNLYNKSDIKEILEMAVKDDAPSVQQALHNGK